VSSYRRDHDDVRASLEGQEFFAALGKTDFAHSLKEIVKILCRVIPDCFSLRDTCVGHEQINCLPTMDRSSFASSVAPLGVRSLPYASARPSFGVDTPTRDWASWRNGRSEPITCAPVLKCQRKWLVQFHGKPRPPVPFYLRTILYSLPLDELLSRALSSQHLNSVATAPVVIVGILSLSSRNRFVSKNKILVIFVPRSMVAVGIQDQLGVGPMF